MGFGAQGAEGDPKPQMFKLDGHMGRHKDDGAGESIPTQFPTRQNRGVWGAEPLAQSLWLKAKEIVRANGEPPHRRQSLASRVSHTREASVEITGPGFTLPLPTPPPVEKCPVRNEFFAMGRSECPIIPGTYFVLSAEIDLDASNMLQMKAKFKTSFKIDSSFE